MEALAFSRNMDISSVVIEGKKYTGTDVGRSGDMTLEACGTYFPSASVFSVK